MLLADCLPSERCGILEMHSPVLYSVHLQHALITGKRLVRPARRFHHLFSLGSIENAGIVFSELETSI